MSHNNETPRQTTTARFVPYSQTWHHAKIAIRVLIICFCALTIGLSFLSIVFAIGMGPVIIADVAWIIAEFVALGIRWSKKRGIHPIVHLILDTLFPVAYLYVGVMYAIDMGRANGESRNKVAEIFIVIFVMVLVILHFVLFFRGCVEVRQRMVTWKKPKPMYYVPGQEGPFVANREPLEAEMDPVPTSGRSSASTSSVPDKKETKVAESHARLGADRL